MIHGQSYTFEAEVWLYSAGKASWHFCSLPPDLAAEIKFFGKETKRGWGSLPVSVTIGTTRWKTSLFPYGKDNTYLLPLKATVREAEGLREGTKTTVTLDF